MPAASASMIVRNEEAGIAAALESLAAIRSIDEVVIIDTGSTDRTIEIARAERARTTAPPPSS